MPLQAKATKASNAITIKTVSALEIIQTLHLLCDKNLFGMAPSTCPFAPSFSPLL
jgi:hypothetical protein